MTVLSKLWDLIEGWGFRESIKNIEGIDNNDDDNKEDDNKAVIPFVIIVLLLVVLHLVVLHLVVLHLIILLLIVIIIKRPMTLMSSPKPQDSI